MMGFEPMTSSLPRKRSTPELHRLSQGIERETRLELATPTLEGLCSTNWAIPACLLLRVKIVVGREGLLESCGFSWTRLRLGSNLRILLKRSPMLNLSTDVGREGFEPPKSYDSRFTVYPSWPLWYLPGNSISEWTIFFCQSRWRDSNPRPADYKSAALTNWATSAY